MIKLDFETSPTLVEMRSDAPVTKGGSHIEDHLSGVVALSEPYVAPITVEMVNDDAALADFLNANTGQASFFRLHTTCTFFPQEGEPFKKAWLTFTFSRADGDDTDKPTVVSMAPARLGTPVKMSKSVSVGPSLKIESFSIDGKLIKDEEWEANKIYLEAFLVDSNPFWEFKATEQVALQGSYQLSMTVRVPTAVSGMSKMALRATIERKRLGLIPFTTDFPESPQFSVMFR